MEKSKFDAVAARTNMVQQMLRPWNILNQRVLDAFQAVPRHQFAPEAYREIAYSEIRLPINESVSMLSPMIEGRLLQESRIEREHTVLVVGTGSGYLSACVAQIADSVTSVDIDPQLSQRAQERCEALNYGNIEFKTFDIAEPELSELDRFDIIILTGSVQEAPLNLIERLNDRGRLTAVVGEPDKMQLVVHHRFGETIKEEPILETTLERLIGFEDKPQFVF